MIDVENIIFTALATQIRSSFPGSTVYGEYVEVPAAFPCVTIVEADNRVLERTRDLSGIEHHAEVMYEINVYVNNTNGKKQRAHDIANVIDNVMSGMLFTRTFRGQIPNVDRSIYRITIRYKGVIGEAVNAGNKILYPMFTTD